MASIHHEADLAVSAATAWDFLERYARAEVHVFSLSVGERMVGDVRVITLADGSEIAERNVTLDPEHLRTVYTMTGLYGSEHHQAEIRIERTVGGGARVVWVTDYLPHEIAEQRAPGYVRLFAELVAALNAHIVAT